MAKKRLNIKDKTGLPVDYDISAENVTIDGEGGKPLTQKLQEITETEAQAVRSITFNGQSYSRSDGGINIGEQEQPNWNESNPNYRTYIRNKPTLLSQFTNDCGFVTSSQIPEGADLSTVFASVAYDPTTSRINFFGKGSNTVLAYLDAAPFIVDGMVENVTLDSSTNELVITFNTASGKSPIRVPLGSISGQGTVHSVKMNGGTPIQPVNGVIDLGTVITEHQSLSSYATKSYVDDAVQQAEQPETVVINSDGANIVDEHNNNSVLLAPSARQMKLMYDNFMALYNSLANIAFTDGKPTLDWVGTKTKYTLSYGTLTGCTADVAAGQVNEGALRIKLTPTQASYAFTSVTVNGNSVTPASTGDADGSVYIDIIVNHNVTVSATAVSGRSISFDGGGGCTIDAASVANGQDLDTTIRAKEHYTLPSSITVTIGGSSVSHTYTRAQDNKTATLHLDAANITGDLTITCTAVEDNHAVLTFGQLSNVTIKSGTRDLVSGSHIYDGETISIKPANGYKLTGKPIFTNGGATPIALSPTTESGDNYNGYDFVFNPISNSTIVITNVSATGLNNTLRASLAGTGNESVDSSTDLSSTITEGSAWSTVLSVKSTADEGTAITSVNPSMEGGGTIRYDANTKRVHTDCVTGNITITVTVAVVGRCDVSWQGSGFKMYADMNHTTELTSPVQVNEGSSFTAYIAADEDFTIDSVTGASYNSSTGLVQISNVSANVAISVSTTNSNPDYKNVRQPYNLSKCFVGDNVNYFLSKKLPLGTIQEGESVAVTFNGNWNSTEALAAALVVYNANDEVISTYADTTSSASQVNTATISDTSASYVRLSGEASALQSSSVSFTDTGGNSRSWSGAGKSYNNFADWHSFVKDCTNIENSDGNFIGAIQSAPTMATATNVNNLIYAAVQSSVAMRFKSDAVSDALTCVCGKYVSLEGAKYEENGETKIRQIKFAAGTHTNNNYMPYIRFVKFDSANRIVKCAVVKSSAATTSVEPDVELTPTLFTYDSEGIASSSTAESTTPLVEFTHAMIAFEATTAERYIKYVDGNNVEQTLFSYTQSNEAAE